MNMRQLRYSVAASLDGYIAGPNGEFDWIPIDPEIDFEAMYAGFSGIVMGRRSYEVFVATGGGVGPALPTYVCSRTLPEGERDGVRFVGDAATHVRRLKEAAEGKPLWLWGGGELFRELSAEGLVDGGASCGCGLATTASLIDSGCESGLVCALKLHIRSCAVCS
jgi:dihydrofolate reductase